MQQRLQSTPQANCPGSKQSSFGKHLLSLGAVATVAGALAIKAALPSLQGPSPSLSEPPATFKASVHVEPATDPFQVVEVRTAIIPPAPLRAERAERSVQAVDPSAPAAAHPSPTKDQKDSAKAALAHRLAALKLRYALLASRPAEDDSPAPLTNDPAMLATVQSADGTRALAAATPVSPSEPQDSGGQPSSQAVRTPTAAAAAADQPLPVTDAAPLQLASLSPDPGLAATASLPVPDKRPKPLVRSKPGAISKPSPNTTAPETRPVPVLAYAAPQEPEAADSPFSGIGKLLTGPKAGLPGAASGLAIYDISAAVVHMPDGSKLKANSGIGHRMNKPQYAYVKNLGPTPPNVYRLQMRERRFHGVEAVRMLPYDVAAMRGRDGMLAHSPLLRNSKGSHGCVAFLEYDKFLRAFKQGKVKTMIVVPEMSKLPKYMALYNERKYASR